MPRFEAMSGQQVAPHPQVHWILLLEKFPERYKSISPPAPEGASPPRVLPDLVVESFDDTIPPQEDTPPWFDPQKWYPICIGDVIKSRYQVLVKLGFGSASTVWLCRDLWEHEYITLKVYETGNRQGANEITVLEHLRPLLVRDGGNRLVRSFIGSFEIHGAVGPHACLTHKPLCLSLKELRRCAGCQLHHSLLKPLIYGVLCGLDYFHRRANIVHTDLQPGNIMLCTDEAQVWDELVQEEWADPSPRKVVKNRVIYASRSPDMPGDGRPTICDFGEAKVGPGPFLGEVMPDRYRALEIILYIPWTKQIDIWSMGLLIWDLLEGQPLFSYPRMCREESRGAHITQIVALLGNLLQDFLHRSKMFSEFFDDNGILKPDYKVEESTSLEAEVKTLQGQEKAAFLALLRRMLQWRPENRASAHDLIRDPWLQVGKE